MSLETIINKIFFQKESLQTAIYDMCWVVFGTPSI